ncbi:B12-binding domain-containing radical SAM protein [Sneathiella glossodoripedis]|uniref:B12-binding domain-containing radical SAM protein n=1 Tax=Sneathiella glossodoripedis TaxID=418853 RepID=UPI00046EACC3|nr:B12-binding domain-containing radical SAM protein [Sneathiella glossodoripedis]
MDKKSIYLADLTHNGLILSSNVFPLSIGLVGAYLLEKKPELYEVDLFKYPEDLSNALEQNVPQVVGFANYSWNYDISRQYAKIIKKLWPGTIVVFGGPNYGLTEQEIEQFWQCNPNIDFHVVQEGEEAFLTLLERLREVEFDVGRLKSTRMKIGNVHYSVGEEIIKGDALPRLKLEDIPSPYLMGLMDKFFDENLGPMIHTTRGCPFSCAFCTEGSKYYNIVSQRESQLEKEMHYISQRVKGPRDLFISDANFGMFKQDYEKARIIAECQEKYDYPKYVHVSTGKNQKERVVDIVKKLNGAVSMAASLQSTDPDVLANVARSNISVDKLSEAGQIANTNDTGTYSELILGLPGDSIAAHKQSLRDTVEMDFDNIRMYQLIMLPQTVLNTPDNRLKYNMKTKHRIMPRSFGRYRVAGEEFVSVESEEILISNSTLPFEDYIVCREMDLTVEILHNGKVFAEIQGLCKAMNLSWFDFIMLFFEQRRNLSPDITKMYDDFRTGTSDRLWDSAEELAEVVGKDIENMLKDERGTNEMSTGKATAFFVLFQQINDALFSLMENWLAKLGKLDPITKDYLVELKQFSLMRKRKLLSMETSENESYSFDMTRAEQHSFKILPRELKTQSVQKYHLVYDTKQIKLLSAYSEEFGGSFDGLGKMLMRYPHIHRLFRKPVLAA